MNTVAMTGHERWLASYRPPNDLLPAAFHPLLAEFDALQVRLSEAHQRAAELDHIDVSEAARKSDVAAMSASARGGPEFNSRTSATTKLATERAERAEVAATITEAIKSVVNDLNCLRWEAQEDATYWTRLDAPMKAWHKAIEAATARYREAAQVVEFLSWLHQDALYHPVHRASVPLYALNPAFFNSVGIGSVGSAAQVPHLPLADLANSLTSTIVDDIRDVMPS